MKMAWWLVPALTVVTASSAQVSTRTNGLFLTEALPDLQAAAKHVSAHILDQDGKPRMAATLLSRDGYFITKASETPSLREATLRFGDGHQSKVREVWRDPSRDLALGVALDAKPLPALRMLTKADLPAATWLFALHGPDQDIRLGVHSAKRRHIPGMGAALGIRMDPEPRKAKQSSRESGVRISGVATDSPAAIAGLRENDLLLEIEGQPMTQFAHVREIISQRQPGDELKVRYRRDGKDSQVSVRLASRTKVLTNWDGEDYASGGVSLRTDGFPDVLQHDLPLDPSDMGGPLFDLSGNLVAINISRVDRVTTFALPLESFWQEVRQRIVEDRKRATPLRSAAPESDASGKRSNPAPDPVTTR